MLLNGEGKQATASGTTAEWIVSKSGSNNISVYVVGDVAVFVAVQCTTTEFDALYAANKCIRVQPQMTYNFSANNNGIIDRICYRTATSTSAVDFAAF